MVARTVDSLSLPASAVAGRGSVVQFDVDEAIAMIRQGMVAEDSSAELLNGFIVHTDRSALGGDPTMHSPGHAKSVRKLTALVSRVDSPTRHAQILSPIVCGDRQMPEADFAVVKGGDDDYTDHLPTAAETHSIVEVADSSLERDRDEKLPIYARAGIAQYVILNLRNRSAQVYEIPAGDNYQSTKIFAETDTIELLIGKQDYLEVGVAELLP